MGFWHCLSILAPLQSVAIEIECSACAPCKIKNGRRKKKTLEALSNRLLELDSTIEKRNNSRFREASDSETYNVIVIGEVTGTRPVSSPILPECQEKNDREYEPDTLEAYQASLHRYLAHKHYRGNILKDDVFKHNRTAIMSKRKSFKQQGLGNKIMRADPFINEELEILRKKSLLGKDEHFLQLNRPMTCLSFRASEIKRLFF